MLDTRIGAYANSKPMKGHISEMDAHQNLPPGFNPNVPTVTVQHTPSVAHQLPPPIMVPGPALQGPPPGAQAHHFYGHPGTGFYGGHSGGPMQHMRGSAFHGKTQQFSQPINEPQQKTEEPDASELAMLGIDPSDFAEFGE